MIKQLLKNLYAFIITAMMFSVSANAQIIYTDLIPNKVLSCTFQTNCSPDYSLDLNNDGINDFVLSARKKFVGCGVCGGQTVYTMANGDSAVISSTSISWIADQVGGYTLNTLIDSSLGWTNAIHTLVTKNVNCVSCSPSQGSHLVHSNATGPWLNVSGKYLPLKIQVGTLFYYGWVRLAVSIGSNTVSFTIMDYAYNSISGQPILAGQTTTTGIIENSFAASINLFPNPATNQLTIENGKWKMESVAIYDVTGREVYGANHQTVNANHEITIDVSKFLNGVYLVQIQTADFITTKKLVIKK